MPGGGACLAAGALSASRSLACCCGRDWGDVPVFGVMTWIPILATLTNDAFSIASSPHRPGPNFTQRQSVKSGGAVKGLVDCKAARSRARLQRKLPRLVGERADHLGLGRREFGCRGAVAHAADDAL